jgi:hypothetical protein
MDIENQTPWAADAMPMWTQNRTRQPVLVVKTGYRWDEQGELHPLSQSDIVLEKAERYYNDDPSSHSLQADLDLVPFKQGFELTLTGTAHFPRPVEMFEVALQLIDRQEQPNWQKSLRIIGPHHWQRNLLGWLPSKTEPIASLPLQYEYAFGGSHPDRPQKANQKNPAGLGHHVTVGAALPQIQQLPLINKKHNKPEPAGFGPLPRHWQPRQVRQRQVNADAAIEGYCPYPFIVDPLLYNSAPKDQQFSAAPSPDLRLRLKNLDKQQPNQTVNLPNAKPEAVLSNGDKVELNWDTLVIDSDNKQLFQLWRGVVPIALLDIYSVDLTLNDATLAAPEEAAL